VSLTGIYQGHGTALNKNGDKYGGQRPGWWEKQLDVGVSQMDMRMGTEQCTYTT
jgi:hypothetical protein